MTSMETTLKYRGVEFDVEYDYQPFEPAERGPEAQYPGSPEYIEQITKFEHQNVVQRIN